MRWLVTIDLRGCRLDIFDIYESAVLPLVEEHGGRIEMRVRALDGASEAHLLFFPDERCFERFLCDPVRVAAREQWGLSGANATRVEVKPMPTKWKPDGNAPVDRTPAV
jgi:hypothetical protein